jgi:hypothetical protein
MKKQDPELKWPDIVESWESLTAGSMQLLKGTSIYLVGDSTEINDKVARELAVGLGYTSIFLFTRGKFMTIIVTVKLSILACFSLFGFLLCGLY